MKDRRLLKVIVIILLFFAYVIFTEENSKRLLNLSFSRNIQEIDFNKKFSKDLEVGIAALKQSKNRTFLHRFPGEVIIEIDQNAKIIREIGKTGSGPGEYRKISNWDVFDDKLVIYDQRQNRVIQYNLNEPEEHKTYIIKNRFAARAIPLDTNILLMKTVDYKKLVLKFIILNIKTNEEKILTSEIPPVKHPLAYDGEFFSNENKEIVFVGYRFGIIIKFDNDSISYVKRTIDKTPEPNVITQDNMIFIDEKAPYVTESVYLDNENIYLVSGIGSYVNRSIDVYDLKTGEYQHSFTMPLHNDEAVEAITLSEEYIITAQNDEVVYYEKTKL
jgi:hypothetical protein